MAKVTKLEYQKNNKERVNLYLDGQFYAGLSLETVLKFSIKEGKEIDEQKLSEFLFEDNKQKAFARATDLISKFIKTEKQIREYLKQKGFDAKVVDEVVLKLKTYGFIDDLAYAQSFVNFKKNVCGAKKLKQELFSKGVSKEIIDQVLDGIRDDSEQSCMAQAEKYMKNKEKTPENKVRLNRFLLSRGFDFADINSVINKIIQGSGDDGWN